MAPKKICVTVRVSPYCNNEVDCLRNVIIGREVETKMTWAELFKEVGDITFAPTAPYVVSRVNNVKHYNLYQPISDVLAGYKYNKKIYPFILNEIEYESSESKPEVRLGGRRRHIEENDEDINEEPKEKANKQEVSCLPATATTNVGSDGVFKLPPPPVQRPFVIKTEKVYIDTDGESDVSTGDYQLPTSSGPSCSSNRCNITSKTTEATNYEAPAICGNADDSIDSTYSDVDIGVKDQGYKQECLNRLLHNVSNQQLLKIHEELRKVLREGRWVKATSNIPITATWLIDLLRVDMPK